MRCTARMHQRLRIGQVLQQGPGTAGMIQMYMGQDQPLYLRRRQPGRLHRGQHLWHRQRGAAIDQGAALRLDDQIRCIELHTTKAGIDGVDVELGCHCHSHPAAVVETAV